jgi:hypothetical protein
MYRSCSVLAQKRRQAQRRCMHCSMVAPRCASSTMLLLQCIAATDHSIDPSPCCQPTQIYRILGGGIWCGSACFFVRVLYELSLVISGYPGQRTTYVSTTSSAGVCRKFHGSLCGLQHAPPVLFMTTLSAALSHIMQFAQREFSTPMPAVHYG